MVLAGEGGGEQEEECRCLQESQVMVSFWANVTLVVLHGEL